MPAWTDTDAVLRALGPDSGADGDPYLEDVVDAANAFAWNKRREAGYVDPDTVDEDAPAPNAAVALGTTTFAVDLYKARGSTDNAASYSELDGFVATYGGWSNVRRLLGIGRAQVDTAGVVTPMFGRRLYR